MSYTSRLDNRIYADLRERLVDRTRRNRLLHFRHTAKAALVRIVDAAPDHVLAHLQNEGRFRFKPLPDPDDDPPDERAPTFGAALTAARVTDEAYRKALAELDSDDPSAAAKEARVERELHDRVRSRLGLPPRPQRRGIDLAAHARAHGVEPAFDLAPPRRPQPAKHTDGWLRTLLFPNQLRARVSGLARKAREVQQETGVDTLHLAVGFLEWFEDDASDVAFSSPLLLLPVSLERRTVRGSEEEFRLAALDNVPVANLSLELRLRDDFHLTLPAFEPEAEDPVEGYLAAVAEAVRPFRRWRIRRFLTLAAFSFARIAMYRDLDPANWKLSGAGGPAGHPLVRPLLRGGADEPDRQLGGDAGTFAEEYEIDQPEVERLAPVLVHDADSSQHSAIIDAMQGRSFVIEGPPGTGKSQTIANLIANVLQRGDTVLFVSEKMAALEVVKAMLGRVGLDRFCLPLHAAGAKPSTVIETLRSREALAVPRLATVAAAGNGQALRARSELKAHLVALHAEVGPVGETVHALVGRLAELGRVLPDLPAMLRNRATELPDSIDAAATAVAHERLETLETASVAPERPGWNPCVSPFRLLERADLFPDEQAALLEELGTLARGCEGLRTAAKTLPNWVDGAAPNPSLAAVRSMVNHVRDLVDPAPIIDRALLVRMATPEGVADGLWTAHMASDAQEAATRLGVAGVRDPTALRPELLGVAIRSAGPLGVAGCRIAEMPMRARMAAAEVEDLDAQARTVEALADILGIGPDPEVGAIRLACSAAQLAAESDPAWHTHRRPGLERHVEWLDQAAARQDALEIRLREVSTQLNVEDVSHLDLGMSASTLRKAGLFGFLHAEVRGARRLFDARWCGGPRPKRKDWAEHLERAAEVLAEREGLRRDARLCAALSGASDPLCLPLRQIALTARWQRRVHETLAVTRVEGAELRAALVTVDADRLHRLATMAQSALALLAFLERAAPREGLHWSVLRSQATARAAALGELAKALAASALDDAVLISELRNIAAAREQWQGAITALRSARAQTFLAGALSAPEALRAAVEFAGALWARLRNAASFLLADGWTDQIAGLRASAERASNAASAVEQALHRLGPLGLGAFARAAERQPIEIVHQGTDALVAAGGELSAYLRFAAARFACVADPLAGPVLHAFEETSAPLRHMPEALDWLVAWTLVRRRAKADREVFSRTGDQLSALRQHFATSDRDRKASDTRFVISAVLRRRVPPGSSVGSKREWTDGALLQNEFTKHRRHVPVRDLLARAADAVLALTPCLMMSPLTVAQYLRPGRVAFDFVVMDEASQIKPEDAVGTMLRARQAIVVGDPKQLPPTNFFDRAVDETDDEEEDEEDAGEGPAGRLWAEDRVAAESVLDLAMRAFRPARRLRWHYRSQHESLIAFSNREFYDNNLVVFPAARAVSETLGIELVRVDGRWRDRVNTEEAKAVARAVVDFMCRHPGLSHGVVAMNQPQRELIEAEIDLLAARDAAAVDYCDHWEQQLEPPFVKNLENVQGDERDVIFISLGWGRSPEGAMHQRFFPVNRRTDGHRRLNVLFTRAKRKIVLFASLDPEDILVDPEKTAPGVRILRDYLAYARDGKLERGVESDDEADSPFETSVANALRARGHDVALQVGVAGYRIDIAVRHPTERQCFVLGIECDGATYHSARSARDRDRLRQEALERLGWRLTRVWSTDWFRDPASQADRLSAEIARAVAEAGRPEGGRNRLVDPPPEPTEETMPSATGVLQHRRAAANAPQEGSAPHRSSADEPVDAVERQGRLTLSADRQPSVRAPVAPAAPPAEAQLVAPRDLADVLRCFRDEVIKRDLPGSEPNRCILREEMIRVIVGSRLDDPADFYDKIPQWLRAATDGRQVRYLEPICEIVAEHHVSA